MQFHTLLMQYLLVAVTYATFLDAILLERGEAPTCNYTLIEPKPKHLHCGIQGTARNRKPIHSITGFTQDECASDCFGNPSCKSFGYSSSTEACKEYKHAVRALNITQGPSGTYFYNMHCYSANCTCADPETLCGSSCTQTADDPNNCGTCNNVCPSGVCSNSTCVCTSCGEASPCPNLTSDPNNCGTCGNVCSSGQCSGSTCQCGFGEELCGSPNICDNLVDDNNNCGSCGRVCPGNTTCTEFSCE